MLEANTGGRIRRMHLEPPPTQVAEATPSRITTDGTTMAAAAETTDAVAPGFSPLATTGAPQVSVFKLSIHIISLRFV